MLAHASRIGAALLGGYAFTWGFTALGIVGLVALGADFHDAETGILLLALLALLALLVFLALLLWTFAVASVVRAWAVLAGGGAVMTAAAWALQRVLLG